jgi:hypothetical protein
MKEPQLGRILDFYDLRSQNATLERFGSGHIHKTYRIIAGDRSFIMQEFNDMVFKFPDRISFNQEHLLNQFNPSDLPFELPLPIKNLQNTFFTRFEDRLFRIFPFVPGVTKDAIEKKHQARVAAGAFAAFISVFSNVDAKPLKDPIPGFHDLDLRFKQFEKSIDNPQLAIDQETQRMINYYLGKRDLLEVYRNYQNTLPKRVTHNDTKINNLIFNSSLDKVNALIDLDTIMPGYLFYDFGDLVRTVACTEDESSVNWGNIMVDTDKYEGLLEGFFQVLSGKISDEELDSLTFGGEMMTLIMGIRFLTDHLNGNIYYQVNYKEQNLHRSINQSELLSSLIAHRPLIGQLEQKVKERAS